MGQRNNNDNALNCLKKKKNGIVCYMMEEWILIYYKGKSTRKI